MPHPFFDRPESLEQVVERQYRARKVREEGANLPLGSSSMRVHNPVSLGPSPMTPLMRERVEARRQAYEWYSKSL